MYAIEFETNINSPFILLQHYEQFMNQQVKVIVLAQDTTNLQATNSFSVLDLSSFSKGQKKQEFSRMDAYDDAI